MHFAFSLKLSLRCFIQFLNLLVQVKVIIIFTTLLIFTKYQNQQNLQCFYRCKFMEQDHISIIKGEYNVLGEEYQTLLHRRFILEFTLLFYSLQLFYLNQLL